MCEFWEALQVCVQDAAAGSGRHSHTEAGYLPAVSDAGRAAALGAELQLSPQSIDDTAGFGGAEGMPSPSWLASGRRRATLKGSCSSLEQAVCQQQGVPASSCSAAYSSDPSSTLLGRRIEIDKALLTFLSSAVQRQRGVEPKPRQQRADRGDALCPSTPCWPSQSPGAEGLAASCCPAQDCWSHGVSVQSHGCCQPLGPASGGQARTPKGRQRQPHPERTAARSSSAV